MKKMSIRAFESFVERDGWTHTQRVEVIEKTTRFIDDRFSEEEGDQIEIGHTWGTISITSELEGVTIVRDLIFSYDDNDEDSLEIVGNSVGEWIIDGLIIVDEEGDPVPFHHLAKDLPSAFEYVDEHEFDIKKTEEIDMDGTMKTYTLPVDNAPDIRFKGEIIAEVSSSPNHSFSDYSGQTGRWTELRLYKTEGGKYICYQIGHTQWQGERTRHSAKICTTIDEVKEYFGYRWLAKDLYEKASIDAANDVE